MRKPDPILDAYYMGLALERAAQAGANGEVPVGAVLVIDGTVYSSHANERENSNDPTAHAEILALRHAADTRNSWRLEESTLYATVEPCLLCTGALYLARVKRAVFGCSNPKGGALLYVSARARELNLNHTLSVTQAVRAAECAKLLEGFFASRRKKNFARS